MSTFIRIVSDPSLPEPYGNKTIRVSVDTIAALIADGRTTFVPVFKPNVLPDIFYKGKWTAYIDEIKIASMGLQG